MKKVLSYLDKNIELVFIYFFGAICLVAVALQILARIMNVSIAWTEEVCRYSFVWVCFLGMSYGIKEKLHIRFELLLGAFKGKGRIIMELFIDLVLLVLFCMVFYFSIYFVKASAGRLAPALNISKNIVNVSAPVGFVLCILRTVQDIAGRVALLRRKD